MDAVTKVIGREVNSMEKVSLSVLRDIREMVSGRTERDFIGSTKLMENMLDRALA
jgi:hypothetical protein